MGHFLIAGVLQSTAFERWLLGLALILFSYLRSKHLTEHYFQSITQLLRGKQILWSKSEKISRDVFSCAQTTVKNRQNTAQRHYAAHLPILSASAAATADSLGRLGHYATASSGRVGISASHF
jgi:hypothetical protein